MVRLRSARFVVMLAALVMFSVFGLVFEAGTGRAAGATFDLEVSATESPSPVAAGNQATFMVAVTNTTAAAIDGVSVQVDAGVVNSAQLSPIVSVGSLVCTGPADSLACLFGTVQPGQTITEPVVVATLYGQAGDTLEVFAAVLNPTIEVTTNSSYTDVPITAAASPGYRLAASDGGVFSFDAEDQGSLGGLALNAPIVGVASTVDGQGYWLVAADGGVFAFGDAPFYGSAAGLTDSPAVAVAAAPSTGGFAVATAKGQIWQFTPGTAPTLVYSAPLPLNAPVVGMAADPATGGYWLVASDGGVFAFDAPFEGSTGATALNRPVVGMAADPATGGYWLVASDGGVFAFDAPFEGSTGSIALNKPVVGMTVGATPPNTIPVAVSGTLLPACSADQLSVSLGAGGGGLGHEGFPIVFTNVGTTTCVLSGYPNVTLLDASGQPAVQAIREPGGYLGGLVYPETLPPVLIVTPGDTVSAMLEGTDSPQGTATTCPNYPAATVTGPDPTTSVTLSFSTSAPDPQNLSHLPGCSPPTIEPLVAGISGRGPGS